jgi:hypothetical protein
MGREEAQMVLGYVLGINDSSLFSAGHALGGWVEGSSVDDDYDGKRGFFWRGSSTPAAPLNPSKTSLESKALLSVWPGFLPT